MTRIPEENKLLAWLTAGILVALMAAQTAAIIYVQHNFHYTGKGSRTIEREIVFYTPTLIMAATLLLLLCFRHSLWRLLFSFALAANVVVALFFIILGFLIDPETVHRQTSYLGIISNFIYICNIHLLIIYFKRQ